MNSKTTLFLILLTLAAQLNAQTPLPQVVSGKIERIENFRSKYITPRNIDIWLPEGYTASAKCAVLYMHDGQMLYDPSHTWNKQAWEIDDVASALLLKDEIRNLIVVGIWNGDKTRHQDYFPEKPFERLTKGEKEIIVAQLSDAGRAGGTFSPRSDNYLKFIVKELKPYIDSKYAVNTGRENTFIAGSSMGGLISLYAICEYPAVFGGAACLSTHWPGTFTLENNPFPDTFLKYLGKSLPDPGSHKIYFDHGDQTLDALYPGIQVKADSIMVRKGYDTINWVTRYFPGENHSEQAWNKRLNIPLLFLLGKYKPTIWL